MSVVTRRPLLGVAPTRRNKVIFGLCVAAILVLAVESAVELALGGNKLLLVVPIAAFAGIGMTILGLVNFENFVFTTIALRASLDITKPQAWQHRRRRRGQSDRSRSRPRRRPCRHLHRPRILLDAHARCAKAVNRRPASIHRVCLILFTAAGFLSLIDSANPGVSLLEGIRVPAVATMLAVLEVMLVDREMIKRLSRRSTCRRCSRSGTRSSTS